MIKKIAILTSGGDAPGMNPAVKAIVNASIKKGLEPYVVYEGYKGLTEGNFKKVSKKDVKFIGDKGGTFIYSARFPEFKEEKIRKIAVSKMKKEGIDALIAIGGDGSYMGASKLTEMGIKTIGLPGTIDNDISSTDFTIGFHTALSTITKAVDQIRDTSESHNRANIVEVMGKYCGDLALNAAIAVGAEVLSTSERQLPEEEIVSQTKKAREEGNRSIIIMVTENIYDVKKLAQKIQSETNIETKATTIGHPQRGGVPSAEDRILASRMGAFAVEKLIEGQTNVAVNLVNNKLSTQNILEVVKMERPSRQELLNEYDSLN
ncbi:MAG: ATP-dependent 6-phosphofructokinase [Candidatus Tyloplasma litorale]|nr:MAG: ATP-dependent 6-phosphofructokinase [Mycoplasmatales bacterium]